MLRAQSTALARYIAGTTTNDSAAAGFIGEFITATVATGGAITLTSPTTATVTSISLTAGDWDVNGAVDYNIAATTSITQLQAGISAVAATLAGQAGGSGVGTDPTVSVAFTAMVITALPYVQMIAPVRVSLAATTTIFLVAQGVFSVAGLTAFGTIRARRVR